MHRFKKLPIAIAAGLLLPACLPETETPTPETPVEISFLMLSDANASPLDFEPWVIDSNGNVRQLADINSTGSSDPGTNASLEPLNGMYFFSADDGVNGRELWVTDGTTDGTRMLKDINAGGSSNPGAFKVWNEKVYFSATQDSVVGGAIWVSDGTEAGTELLKDLRADTGGTGISEWVEYNDKLYMSTYSGQGRELHVTDGTAEGTVQVVDLRTGSDSSSPDQFAVYNGELFFEASDGTDIAGGDHAFSLFKTDGTAAGTALVSDINPHDFVPEFGYSEARIDNMIVFNNLMLFEATNGTDGNTLWRSDGTEAGTESVVNIRPGSNAQLSRFTVIGDTAYFYATDDTSEALWKTDGSTEGTALIQRFVNVRSMTALNGQLLISAYDDDGSKLFVSDGTAEGTNELLALNGSASFQTELGNYAFFAYDSDDDDLDELWKTDGTAAGTVQVADGEGTVVVFEDD